MEMAGHSCVPGIRYVPTVTLEPVHDSVHGLANVLYATEFASYGVNYVGSLAVDCHQGPEFLTCSGRFYAAAFI